MGKTIDRRTGRGKQGGALQVSPTVAAGRHVAAEEIAEIVRRRDRLQLAQSELELAQAEFNLTGRKLLQRYGVPPTHEIDLTTGEIRAKR